MEEEFSKYRFSQKELKEILLNRLWECIEEINKIQVKIGIPKEGLTIHVCEASFDNLEWDITIALTPKGQMEKFIVHMHREGKDPFIHIDN